MWIVFYADKTRHSAWLSKSEALKQALVLKNSGYYKANQPISDFVEFDETVSCENGHYFV